MYLNSRVDAILVTDLDRPVTIIQELPVQNIISYRLEIRVNQFVFSH